MLTHWVMRNTPLEIGQRFLDSEARLREWDPKILSFKSTVIRRLDEYINGRNYTFARLRVLYQCPECFEPELEAFLQNLRDEGYGTISKMVVRKLMNHIFSLLIGKHSCHGL